MKIRSHYLNSGKLRSFKVFQGSTITNDPRRFYEIDGPLIFPHVFYMPLPTFYRTFFSLSSKTFGVRGGQNVPENLQ